MTSSTVFASEIVATIAAMKSGLKVNPVEIWQHVRQEICSNHCRDEKRTESELRRWQPGELRSVATIAAMKSGLKAAPIQFLNSFAIK